MLKLFKKDIHDFKAKDLMTKNVITFGASR